MIFINPKIVLYLLNIPVADITRFEEEFFETKKILYIPLVKQ